MSAHVLLNLLNELGLAFFATSLINSIIQEHECQILFIICHLNDFEIAILAWKKRLLFFIIYATFLLASLRHVNHSRN